MGPLSQVIKWPERVADDLHSPSGELYIYLFISLHVTRLRDEVNKAVSTGGLNILTGFP